MKLFKVSYAVLVFSIRIVGVVFCILLINITSSRLVSWLKGKRKPKANNPKLDLEIINMPEMGRKLQNSFK
jgi:hypothetical protein